MNILQRIKRPDLLIILILLAIPHLFLFGAVFGGKALFADDMASMCYPAGSAAGEMYRSLKIYQWDPYIFSGLPAASEIQTAIYYPFNLIFAFVQTVRAMLYFITLHLFLSSLFMYLYLREIKLSRISSLFGALIFAYNGFYLMHAVAPTVLATEMWLPLILLFIEKALNGGRTLLYSVLAGLGFGMCLLAGHPQVAAFVCFALVFYFGFKLYKALVSKAAAKAKRVFLLFALIFLIGFALAAIELVPFLEFSKQSLRVEKTGYEVSSSIAVSPMELQTILVPGLREKGSPLRTTGGTGALYMGVAPFFLAIFALLFVRDQYVVFYAVLGAFSFLAALGSSFPLHFLLYHLVPFYRSLQVPIRLIFLFSFSLSVLSAFGLERVSKDMESAGKFAGKLSYLFIFFLAGLFLLLFFSDVRDLILSSEGGLAAPLIFLLLFFALLGALFLFRSKRIGPAAFMALIVILALADLLSFGTRYFKLSDVTEGELNPSYFDFLKSDKSLYRVAIPSEAGFNVNLCKVHKVQTINGYNSVLLNDYIDYLFYNDSGSLDFSRIPAWAKGYPFLSRDSKMTGLLNVKYFIFPVVKDGGTFVGIAASKYFLPRTFVVPGYSVVESRDRMLETLGSKTFDPRSSVLLDLEPGLSGYNFLPGTVGTAEIVEYSPDRIDMNVKADGDALLFLSEIYYPGWKAYVDGLETKIYRADYLFRSIAVKRGEHSISFIYDPLSFRLGRYISLGALVLCGIMLGFARIFYPKGSD